jgi:Na+/phosphate symporter
LNETTTKAETFERELQTLREIMKQQEQQKKEYISKLKRELDMVEQEW